MKTATPNQSPLTSSPVVPPYDMAPAKHLSMEERLRLDKCEKVIERGLKTFEEVANALLEIRNGLLYRQTHSTFEAYCRERWQMGARRGRQLADAAEVMRNLAAPDEWPKQVQSRSTESGLPAEATEKAERRNAAPKAFGVQPELPTGERQVRPLTKLPLEEQRPAWEEAKAMASERGEPVGGRDVEKAVEGRTSNIQTPNSKLQISASGKNALVVEESADDEEPGPPFDPVVTPVARKMHDIYWRAGYAPIPVTDWKVLVPEEQEGFTALAHFHLNAIKDLEAVIERFKEKSRVVANSGGADQRQR